MPCASVVDFQKALNHLRRDEFSDMCDAVLALEIKLGIEFDVSEIASLMAGTHPEYRAALDTSGDLDEIRFYEGDTNIFVYTL